MAVKTQVLMRSSYYTGYEQYNQMRCDPMLCFLDRCGPVAMETNNNNDVVIDEHDDDEEMRCVYAFVCVRLFVCVYHCICLCCCVYMCMCG